MENQNISEKKHKKPHFLDSTVLGPSSLGLVDWVILVMMMFLVLSVGYTL